MKTFDYESAWNEQAKPAFLTLSPAIVALLKRTSEEASELSQLRDCSMPWPETDLKQAFAAVPSEELAFAARVLHACGNWFPTGGKLELPGREHGGHWKFAHYADQTLRTRLGISGETPFQIHEGAIRICYSSRDMWTWSEAAPATEAGLQIAKKLLTERTLALGSTRGDERDSRAYNWHQKQEPHWSDNWRGLMNTAHYMREEQEIKAVKPISEKDRRFARR